MHHVAHFECTFEQLLLKIHAPYPPVPDELPECTNDVVSFCVRSD